jgi:hypothetical protein
MSVVPRGSVAPLAGRTSHRHDTHSSRRAARSERPERHDSSERRSERLERSERQSSVHGRRIDAFDGLPPSALGLLISQGLDWLSVVARCYRALRPFGLSGNRKSPR